MALRAEAEHSLQDETSQRRSAPWIRVTVERSSGDVAVDSAAAEEPLEIRLDGEPLLVTMRTPGDDRALVAGLLHAEGFVRGAADLAALEVETEGVLDAILTPSARQRLGDRRLAARALPVSSACGVCGRPSLADLWQRIPAIEPLEPAPARALLRQLPAKARPLQVLFARTGGVHAAALFDRHGELLSVAEDIGRHNAVDKVIGRELLADRLPLSRRILLTSGRAGFEIVQKAVAAAVPLVVAVGAASSLAIELARLSKMTLYSFIEGGGNRHLASDEPNH